MRKIFFAVLVTLGIHTQAQSVKGLYVDGFAGIVGNIPAEDSLLQYAQANGFNYLALYELHIVHTQLDLTSFSGSAPLAAFISKAKTQYGILKIGAIAENYWFFQNRIRVYNQLHSNVTEKFDVYNLEFEFWLTSAVGPSGYYCTTYLQPGGFTCDTAGGFDFYIGELKKIDSIAALDGLISETYVGWPTAGQCHEIVAACDRVLVHAYVTNAAVAYGYTQTRLSYFGTSATTADLIIIFSSEPAFMGPWLSSNPETQAYQAWSTDFSNETAGWTNGINILGYQWFTYTEMPYDLSTDISEQVSPYMIVNDGQALHITCEHHATRTYDIIDMNGKLISTSTVQSAQFDISFSGFPAGIYVLAIYENGVAFRTTFVNPQHIWLKKD